MAANKLDRLTSDETPVSAFPPPPEAFADDEAPPTRRAPVPALERVSDKPPALPAISHTRIRAFAKAALGVVGAAMALSLTACPGNTADPDVPRRARVTQEVVVLVPGAARGEWDRVAMERDGCFESIEHHGFDTRVVARGCLDERDVAGWFARADDLASRMRMVTTTNVDRPLVPASGPEVMLVGADGRARVARDDDDAARLALHARPLLVAVERADRRVDDRRRFDWRRAEDDDRFAPPPPGR